MNIKELELTFEQYTNLLKGCTVRCSKYFSLYGVKGVIVKGAVLIGLIR